MELLRFAPNQLQIALALSMLGASPIWANSNPAFIKGMTVSCQTSGWEWATPEMAATLDELKSLGVNSIAIHPYAQVQNDGHVRFRIDEDAVDDSGLTVSSKLLSLALSVRTKGSRS